MSPQVGDNYNIYYKRPHDLFEAHDAAAFSADSMHLPIQKPLETRTFCAVQILKFGMLFLFEKKT